MRAATWLVVLTLASPAAAEAQDPPQRDEEGVPPGQSDEDPAPEAARGRDEEAEDRAEEARVRARAAELARSPPTEAQLGVPLYPGARFDPEVSAGMVGSEAQYFVFLSADPVEKVIRFYEEKAGKKAERSPGGALIAVKGSSPWPELGVAVQPNALPGGWRAAMKSMITVRKAAQGR